MENALPAGAGVNCARSCTERERKANTRKAVVPDRPTKPIFIVLLRSELNPFGPGSLDVPWTAKMLRLVTNSPFMNGLCDRWIMQILPQNALGSRPPDLLLPSQSYVAWVGQLRLRSSVLDTGGFELIHFSMQDDSDRFLLWNIRNMPATFPLYCVSKIKGLSRAAYASVLR
jgi:hypothetical protein